MKIKIFLFLILLITSKFAISQLSIGISLSGVGFHPIEDKYSQFYKWKIDKKGKFVGFSSVSFLFSYKINDYWGIKVMQSLVFYDCAGKFTGISHFGIDLHDDIIGWKNPKDQFSLSFGPFWYYRRNWTKEPNYTNDPNFITLSQNGKWEKKFIWHGGQIEYVHTFNKNDNLSINFLPGYPYLYTLGMGTKLKL
ncbi:hypothetical protein ACFLQ5_01480 [Bacteroidota bacterium]